MYNRWCMMKQRCNNPRHPRYKDYGGRGVSVCQEWTDSFFVFLDDIGDPPDDGQRWTLERKDNNGNYEPGNCKWATYSEQARNQRVVEFRRQPKNSRMITYNGETLTCSDWARFFGLTRHILHKRLVSLGWTMDQCVGYEPVNGKYYPAPNLIRKGD